MVGLRTWIGSPKAETTPAFTGDGPDVQEQPAQTGIVKEEQVSDATEPSSSVTPTHTSSSVEPEDIPLPFSESQSPEIAQGALKEPQPTAETPVKPKHTAENRGRRFSFRTFSFQPHQHDHKPVISTLEERKKEEKAAEALGKRLHKPMSSKSERRAQESAVVVRTLIIGPSPHALSPKVSGVVAKPQMSKIKSQLLDPKSANRIIGKLKELPTFDDDDEQQASPKRSAGPIHAVCLDHSDHEMDELHFAKLKTAAESSKTSSPDLGFPAFPFDPIAQLSEMFNDLKIIDLITAPDLGVGQPGDGDGLLAGAVPTAQTVIEGIKQITPELMALGFATGKAILPDHTGIYPPKDRISVFTYWWGLELALPPPTLEYLENVESISNSIVNFLSALSLVNNGVREIVPFVRYIAQFIDFEYKTIKKMDYGQGVVCAATWIMPAAMVPRPWDFEDPPATKPAPADPQRPSQPDAGKVVVKPGASLPLLAPLPAATTADNAHASISPPGTPASPSLAAKNNVPTPTSPTTGNSASPSSVATANTPEVKA